MQSRHPGFHWPRPIPRRARAFTLVELLVVIAIIAVLIGLLVPLLGSARAAAKNVACLSNLRQIMMSFHLYAADNKEHLPDPIAAQQSWESLIKQYLPSRESYRCQADGGLYDNLRSSYDWRDTPDPETTIVGRRITEIRRADVVFVFDALPDWHRRGRINVAQADGSTKSMPYQECLKDLDKPINDP